MLLIEANATDEIDVTVVHAHYLPACYLKGFIDPASEVERDKRGEPYVWVRNPSTRVWKNQAPHNVATRPDYYAVTKMTLLVVSVGRRSSIRSFATSSQSGFQTSVV